MSTLYQRIRQRREELGMTQEMLAQKMGYKSRSSINKIEIGKNDIPQSKILDFARALHTSPGYLIGLEPLPEISGEHENTRHAGGVPAFQGSEVPRNKYFLDEETANIAQEIRDNQDLKTLFEITRKAAPDDLKFIVEMIKRMKY